MTAWNLHRRTGPQKKVLWQITIRHHRSPFHNILFLDRLSTDYFAQNGHRGVNPPTVLRCIGGCNFGVLLCWSGIGITLPLPEKEKACFNVWVCSHQFKIFLFSTSFPPCTLAHPNLIRPPIFESLPHYIVYLWEILAFIIIWNLDKWSYIQQQKNSKLNGQPTYLLLIGQNKWCDGIS